jgi:tRNA modification GTPase
MVLPPSSPSSDSSRYLSEDTIAAISSAVGGAISIVRISGPRAFEILKGLTDGASPGLSDKATPRKLYLARILDLDEALFVRFVAPDSFSGEDLVELHLHGGAYIASRVLEATIALGARQALAGEFSFRAVRNGKLSVSQAAAVADLIGASNDGALALALEKLSGTQNQWIQAVAQELKTIAALSEIGIDFSDQDVDEVSLPRLKTRIASIVEGLERLKNSYVRGLRIQEGIAVAFVGLPNAGKSSFFNALLGVDRSIVSEIPGTTRDVVHERITLRSGDRTATLRLEDTAGLRSTEDQIERIGISRSEKSARQADLILFVVDPGGSNASPEANRLQWDKLGRPTDRTIAILTKSDLYTDSARSAARASLADLKIERWVEISAVTGRGMEQAVSAIIDACSRLTQRERGEVILTRIDQLDAVNRAFAHLERAENAPEIELFAADIRQALQALSPLIGETLSDDILGQIFSEFCIGK